MAAFTFFFHPMSRAQIARWAFHEVKADYEPVLVDWANKPAALLEANPMGKLPTIIHHHGGHDHVVTEAAAVCHYLAARRQCAAHGGNGFGLAAQRDLGVEQGVPRLAVLVALVGEPHPREFARHGSGLRVRLFA